MSDPGVAVAGAARETEQVRHARERRSHEPALREPLRRREVDAARAAADESRLGQELRARLQRDLHLRRRQPRLAVEEQRDAAADDRGRHAGAAQPVVGVAAAAGDVPARDSACSATRPDSRARRCAAPGATTSGLTAKSNFVGPREL